MTERTRKDAAYIAMLEDTVIAAACVMFGGKSSPESDEYLTEGVYEQAKDIVETVPRLKGAWTP